MCTTAYCSRDVKQTEHHRNGALPLLIRSRNFATNDDDGVVSVWDAFTTEYHHRNQMIVQLTEQFER